MTKAAPPRKPLTPLTRAVCDLAVGEGLNVRRTSQKILCNLIRHIRLKWYPKRRYTTRLQPDGTTNLYRLKDA